ncbi:NADH-cytochrome b5 reductase-like [Dendroctonus ponderosae]|uniref:NADH-cytochrome b5 reductase-like n=1 Tax=Dendroctonus ponderosae TaxID=77166 RepID=UPI002035DA4E|nr:NADH-cytochrome b5 reductase-like [Dendroctonus ponderosae]XP_048521808.1 NADH-cytochrome b5 reductase-like [Dendroctonus ponderosae]XP_048522111.1 NADH-cytochrome b5 reductase-like [Dendroctonus ponderosae]
MEPPIKPDESDCCNSGCSPCILDVYEDQLRKFRAAKCSSQTLANCLSLTSYSVFRLAATKGHTKDSRFFTFQYKAYTPIYVENQVSNCFTVLVKLYENGRASNLFKTLRVGTETLWRGPYGDFRINYEQKHMLFIAQGTGLAPFYNILIKMLNNEDCYCFLTLIFCCQEKNILLRDELYKLKDYWNFQCELFISGPNKHSFDKKYNEIVHFNRITVEDIQRFMESVKGSFKVLICGSQSFCDNIKNILLECNVAKENITVF